MLCIRKCLQEIYHLSEVCIPLCWKQDLFGLLGVIVTQEYF